MIRKLFVIEEYSEGEFECRGVKYKSLKILDLDKLNELSKKHIIDNNLVEKWTAELGEVEPLEGDDWSFRDLYEDILCDEELDKIENNVFEYEKEEYELDLDNEKDVRILCDLLDAHTYDQNEKKLINSVFLNNHMQKFFSEKEIKSLDVSDKISLGVTQTFVIEIDGIKKEIEKANKDIYLNFH